MHPSLFSLGPLVFHSYGLMVAIGVFFSILFLRSQSERIPVAPETVVDLALVALVSGFVGARVFYAAQFWGYFREAPIDVLKLWQGGIVLYGGLIGGLIGFSIFIRIRRLPFVPLLDLFMPAVALAQGFGRIGCFLNGCCFGIETHLPWGARFPLLNNPVHPTQLYESVCCFLLFGVLFFLLFRRKHLKNGMVALSYFILYPTGRFFIEFLRGDHRRIWLSLTVSQWIGLVIFSLSLSIFVFWAVYDRKKVRHSS